MCDVWAEIDEATSHRVMDHALGRGINLLDTAEVYAAGASEEVVGNWLKSRGVRDKDCIGDQGGW